MNLSKRMWIVLYEAPNGSHMWRMFDSLSKAQAYAEHVSLWPSNLPPLVFEGQAVKP